MSSKLDLGRGYVYTMNTALTGSEDAGKSLNARVTTPHDDWHTLEAVSYTHLTLPTITKV